MEKVKNRSAKRVTNPANKLAAVKSAVKNRIKAAVTPSKKISAQALQQRIQNKAYDLYLSRGCSCGDDMGDWLEAERIVRKELGL